MVQRNNRRAFLQTSAGALAIGLSPAPAATMANAIPDSESPGFAPQQMAPGVASNAGKKPLRLGLIIAIGKDPGAAMAKVRNLAGPPPHAFATHLHPNNPPHL